MIRKYFYIILLSCLVLMPQTIYALELTESDYKQLSEENILIVELFINNNPTYEILEIYQHDDGEFVPLGLISDILDFAIEVSIEDGEARGWFIEENRLFYLSKAKGEAVLNGDLIDIDPRMVIVGLDDIYIDSKLLSSLLPIDFKLDFSNMVLITKPREKLPIQIKLERDDLHAKINRQYRKKRVYKKVKDAYKPYETPVIDADLGYNYSNNSETQHQLSYSSLAQADLGYLTSSFYVSGESNAALSSMRLNLGRKSNDADLLGRIKATSFEIGDVITPNISLVENRNTGRGFVVTNQKLERASQFDSTDFIGDAIPGWEVEIYRNGALNDFLVVDETGRYEFKNVPIFYGNNVFRIVSYGPQGQIRERTETILIDQAILNKGEFSYQASIDEKLLSVFGVDEQSVTNTEDQGLRTTGKIEYGLTNRMTGILSFISTPLDDGNVHSYVSTGLRNSFSRAITNLNFIYDSNDGGFATQFEIATQIKGVSLSIEQNLFNSFYSAVENREDDKKTYESKIAADGGFDLFNTNRLSYRLEFEYEQYEDDRQISNYENRLSYSLKSFNFTNNLDYQETVQNEQTTSTFKGDFSVRTRYRDTSLRLSTNYDIDPESQIQSANLTITQRLPGNTNVNFSARKGFDDTGETSFNLSLNKRFDYFTLSTVGEFDDQSNISAGLRVSFSVGQEPRNNKSRLFGQNAASNGIVSAQAFLDDNYNNVFDGEDYILEDATFKVGTGRAFETKDGSALITNLRRGIPSNIVVDPTSFDDPFWIAPDEGFTVIPRPGHITQINFPVVITTEIDGTIYLKHKGKNRTIARAIIELVDSKGEVYLTTKSEFDGFYIFEGVVPGEYIVRIAPETRQRFNTKLSDTERLIIEKNSDIISGIDLLIQKH